MGDLGLLDSFPCTLAIVGVRDDGGYESPNCTKHREDYQVIDHEKGIKFSGNMALSGRLRSVSSSN